MVWTEHRYTVQNSKSRLWWTAKDEIWTCLSSMNKVPDTSPEQVSWAERQNFLLIAQLHLRDSRSSLRSRSDDLPLHSRSTWFFWTPLSAPLRFAQVGFDPLRFVFRSAHMPVTNLRGHRHSFHNFSCQNVTLYALSLIYGSNECKQNKKVVDDCWHVFHLYSLRALFLVAIFKRKGHELSWRKLRHCFIVNCSSEVCGCLLPASWRVEGWRPLFRPEKLFSKVRCAAYFESTKDNSADKLRHPRYEFLQQNSTEYY